MKNSFYKIILIISMSISIYANELTNLINISGINSAIKEIPVQMSKVTKGSLPGGSDELMQEYKKAVEDSFDTENIIGNIDIYLSNILDSNTINKATNWFNSSLGQRITALLGSKPKRITQDEVYTLRSNKKRLRLMEKLDNAIQLSQNNIEISLTTQKAIINSVMQMMPEELKMPKEIIDQKIKEGKAQTTEVIKVQVVNAMMFNLQSISLQELNEYLTFASSNEGQKFFLNSNEAIKLSVKKASENFGQKIAELTIKNSGINNK